MLIAKTTQTTTIDTRYEYDANGKMIHKVVTETLEIPETPVQTTTMCACDCCDCDEETEAELMTAELEIPVSPMDIIMGAAGIASVLASGCLIFKTLKK